MILNLHEKVRVGAVFENSPRPVWFSLRGEKVTVKDICYRWKERAGNDIVHKYTVTDGLNVFELSFSGLDACWYLEGMDEGDGK
ncbi:hypothetical protein [Seleniivibrio sp.]|uniref:hypothetical protein n=1 Tax=Seleniivibrio sp. TaxID=2898801 RepID=UPI0025D96911|nr:hypothetical protein [Seleniivibrio sp.]MCD8553304.1 hypothetical protein [Seleniivibrio sp.]